MLILGEVQTGVLRHSEAASSVLAEQVLALMAGERVCLSQHPIGYAVSPQTFTGVDCDLRAASGALVRGVGTVAGRVLLTGGRVVQGSAVTYVEPGTGGRRRSWSYYLSRPGVVETLGKTDLKGIGDAHLRASRSWSTVGMGAFCSRLLAKIQESPALDGKPPFVARRTMLRWQASASPQRIRERVRFVIEEDGVRNLRLEVGPEEHADIVALCEDIALHDWLLTALLSMVERARIGVDDPVEVVAHLRPAVDHLLHLWMPAARLGGAALRVWDGLERRAGLSRQWDASVRRIRDQISMTAVLLHLRDSRPSGAPGGHLGGLEKRPPSDAHLLEHLSGTRR